MARQTPTSRSRIPASAGFAVLLGLAAVPIFGCGAEPQAEAPRGTQERPGVWATSHRQSRTDPVSSERRSEPLLIEGGVVKTSWPVTPNQDARSIAKGLAALAASYTSVLPDVQVMEASVLFILTGGELYQGGSVSVSLSSMRENPMYAETVEDNLVMQVHQLLDQKANFEAAR